MGRVWMPKALESDELTLKAMGAKYKVSPRQIAEVNEVPWETEAINDWVIEAGGRMLKSGYAVFEPGNVILLPGLPTEVDPEVKIPPPSASAVGAPSDKRKWLLAGVVGGLLFLGYKNAKRNR